MPAIRAATVLSGLSDGIKTRFEYKTGITVTRFGEMKHISSDEVFLRLQNPVSGRAGGKKEYRWWYVFFAFELATQNMSCTKQIFGNMCMIFIM